MCTKNQEDAHQNQERNRREIFSNDYLPTTQGNMELTKDELVRQLILPRFQKATWTAGRCQKCARKFVSRASGAKLKRQSSRAEKSIKGSSDIKNRVRWLES
jgi:hypothetical protein